MTSRRTPLQPRSRERVQNILDVASDLILSEGIESVTTSAVAKGSGISVGALYQYFADRDAIISRLLEDHLEGLDAKLVDAFGQLKTVSIRAIVEKTIDTHVEYYRDNPVFVSIWVFGNANAVVLARQRERNLALSKWLRKVADDFTIINADAPALGGWFAVEVGDRVIDMAFRADPNGDDELLSEGKEMIVLYLLDRFSTEAGRQGVKVMALPKPPNGF
jgi:AcrR family transcriptional regulator